MVNDVKEVLLTGIIYDINQKVCDETKVCIFRHEYNGKAHTIAGDKFYAELHNCIDTLKDYVDIEIDTTLDKESLKIFIDILNEFYGQME